MEIRQCTESRIAWASYTGGTSAAGEQLQQVSKDVGKLRGGHKDRNAIYQVCYVEALEREIAELTNKSYLPPVGAVSVAGISFEGADFWRTFSAQGYVKRLQTVREYVKKITTKPEEIRSYEKRK